MKKYLAKVRYKILKQGEEKIVDLEASDVKLVTPKCEKPRSVAFTFEVSYSRRDCIYQKDLWAADCIIAHSHKPRTAPALLITASSSSSTSLASSGSKTLE